MQRKKLRIHRPRFHLRTEPCPSFEVTEESPRVDTVKKYLANLEEQHFEGQAKSSSSFSFDLSLAQWKSKAKLHETVPIESIYKNDSVCLYSQEPEMIEQRKKDAQSAYLPNLTQMRNYNNDKMKTQKMFLNFHRKTLNPQSDNKTPSIDKRWVKPMLFSLQEENHCQIRKFSLKKHIKHSLPAPVVREEAESEEIPLDLTVSQEIKFAEAKKLHGIHCFRNKFELILNSRSLKQRAFKLFRCSNPKATLPLSISNRKLQ